MNRSLLAGLLCGCAASLAHGQSTLDTIGVTALQARDPTLNGSGVIVMQVEANPGGGQFEVNPNSPGQPVKLFGYRSALGAARTFPNKVGNESTHADEVAEDFYGEYTGVAPHPAHVGDYEAFFFYASIIQALEPTTARIFNQSFEFGSHDAAENQAYDDYIALYHTVVASGIGDGGPVLTPSDCYNGLGVAAYGGASSTGPASDGRSKPDITAPSNFTSFSTPLVSGAAALLVQDARRQGVDAAAAADSRTQKALLLTGAVKPSGWSHTPSAPLDPNYGAGILNVFNSYEELEGGRHRPVATGRSTAGHPPLTSGASIDAPRGWDYRSISSNATGEGVSHYRITTTGTGALIATLAWNKGYKQTAINCLDLFVYDAGGNLLASSTSAIDNVQQIYLTGLAAGAYDIEVVKIAGPVGTPGVVSDREVYALAWDFER